LYIKKAITQKLKLENYGDQLFVPISQLSAPIWHRKNPIEGREHFLRNSITEHGVKRPIVINNRLSREGIIIDGLSTVQVARTLGIFDVPVFLVDVSEVDEKKYHALFNTSSTELSKEQMIRLMEADYQSYFEPDDEVLQLSEFYDAIEAGENVIANTADDPRPIRKLICNLPPDMADYPESAMEAMGLTSISALVSTLIKLVLEDPANV
jgi:hypothetical protein